MSLNEARKQFAELLPSGMDTDRTYVRLIVDEAGAEVGALWVGPNYERAGVESRLSTTSRSCRSGVASGLARPR